MNISVEVISDVICPWCYIGKRRLEKAIAAYGLPVTLCWHPFQLNPAIPKEGISRREYRIAKFGSWERSTELDANIVSVGKQDGTAFNFDSMERTPNTSDAHRLIWLANKMGIQESLKGTQLDSRRLKGTRGRQNFGRSGLLEVVKIPFDGCWIAAI